VRKLIRRGEYLIVEAKKAELNASASASATATTKTVFRGGDFDRRVRGQISETKPLQGRHSLEILASARWWRDTEDMSPCREEIG
jgi:hypothetical protein